MAHNLDFKADGSASMAYVGQKPWHGLGVEVKPGISTQDMLVAAGLDWTCSKHDMFYDYNGEKMPTGKQALIRDDNGFMLDTVGEGWNDVSNQEAFDFFTDFVEKGQLAMDTAGALQDGRIVWALASTKESFDVFKNDTTNSYLLFSNPHKYGQSVTVKFCATRVVCNNTFTVAINEKTKNAAKINHRSKFDPERVKAILGITSNQTQKLKETQEFLATKKFKKIDLVHFYGDIFGKSEVEGKDLSRNGQLCMDLLETQPGAEFGAGTFYSMFNSVTYFLDHVAGRSNDSRVASSWFGSNEGKKSKALHLALEMAKVA